MLMYKRAINLPNFLNNLLSSLCFNPKRLYKKYLFCAEELKRPREEQSNYLYLISKHYSPSGPWGIVITEQREGQKHPEGVVKH